MTFFTKLSITFFSINAVRFLSILAIVMAFSGEIIVMVNNVNGVKSASTLVSSNSQSHLANRIIQQREFVPTVSTSSSPSSSRTTSAAVASSTTYSSSSSYVPSSNNSQSSTCCYIGNTDVPKEIGGILFNTLERVFCCLILILALLSELPPPSKYTQQFWNFVFPVFGEEFGVGILGVLQVFIGCSILGHSVSNFPFLAGWFLFTIGFLNMLFGLAYGSKIKSLRSIYSLPKQSTPSGLKSLQLQSHSLTEKNLSNNARYEDLEKGGFRGGSVRSNGGIGEQYLERPEPVLYRTPVFGPAI